EHERSVQPDDKDEHPTEVWERSRFHPADDVVRQVKRKEEDRVQRRDGQHDVVFHWIFSLLDLCVPHCPAAFACSRQRCSFTPNIRSHSAFENPATTATLTM